ncbi:cytochrome P450 monooxygenase-like protein 23 [Elsinoe australis]|uniref:Cytochrome P450 monooxygenase-like protein 23 n=1 Tax=Elsinoe australis TaxID=40998 RepID=A0A4U7AYB2_9PEZI|nr:cytochrome P450 monooxygenase-like protein 23 [Elsinoe australis]
MLPALVLAVGLIVLYRLARKVQLYFSLRDFGGHWTAGWTRLWLLRVNNSGKMNEYFREINEKYGTTARIAPHMLITSDPDLYKRMNAVRSTFTRAEWYYALRLHPTRDNITSVIDEDVHTSIRARMAAGYSGKENTSIESDVDTKVHKLFDLLNRSYISSDQVYRPVDLSKVITYFTLDVISQLAFGHEFGFMEKDEDPFGYLANLKEFLPAILVFGAYVELTKLLRLPFMKAVLPKSTDKRGLGKVMGFAADRVGERFGPKPIIRQDMLNSFIKKGLTQEELESETLTQITAGSDSTSSALRMTLHFVCTTPDIQARLLGEIRAAIAQGRVSRPIIKDSEARQLPYLQACIKEGLRMYPPVTGLLAKQVPPEGATIDGKFAPPGTWIGQNSWGMQRRTDIYGIDVDVFRPERWLPKNNSPAEKARIDRMTETVGLVFGYGRFGCLGRGVATMELNKGLIELLLRYNFQPISLSKPFDELCVGFFVHENMWFRVTPREDVVDSALLPLLQMGEASALPGAPEE